MDIDNKFEPSLETHYNFIVRLWMPFKNNTALHIERLNGKETDESSLDSFHFLLSFPFVSIQIFKIEILVVLSH